MKKMSRLSRIIIAVAALSLMSSFFLPIWEIDLSAPQYPEGLSMQIWLEKITGQVDIINGLNHYIGMKHIKAEMFPEFSFLTYIVSAFILLGLVVAVVGKRNLLFGYISLLVIGGIAAMVDFYKWGYDYGHNLDPKAAIQVPGFSYQPPLIGHKQLLNFDAYSFPATGGWLIVAAAVMFIAVWWFEWWRNRKQTSKKNLRALPDKRSIAAVALVALLFSSCKTGPEAFVLGKDACYFCKMTIVSPLFGGEVITRKGKIYKFDDLHCMISYLKSGELKKEDIAQTLTIDYNKQNNFLDVQTASYIVSEGLHSPMNSNAAGFANEAIASEKNQSIKGKIVDWLTLYNQTN